MLTSRCITGVLCVIVCIIMDLLCMRGWCMPVLRTCNMLWHFLYMCSLWRLVIHKLFFRLDLRIHQLMLYVVNTQKMFGKFRYIPIAPQWHLCAVYTANISGRKPPNSYNWFPNRTLTESTEGLKSEFTGVTLANPIYLV